VIEHSLNHGLTFPQSFWTSDYQELFPEKLQELISHLHHRFEERRLGLLKDRQEKQKSYDAGALPEFLPRNTAAVSSAWKVAPIPDELSCRRVEITGPVNSAKMVINMLNRNDSGARADMAMLDFEDSMKPTFENVLNGYKNAISAISGNLSYSTPDAKIYKLNKNDMAYVMLRVRGLHLNETNIKVDHAPVSAGLLDFAVTLFHGARPYLDQKKTPKYYVPKCEHFLEARWWNDLFCETQKFLNLPIGTLRATFLIETLPAAFQVEEILYEIKDHAAGLNVGRWDKIFSDIKILKNHPDRIMADRSSITMQKSWMENYAKRVIKICHERGAFAMGGMAAFTPGKSQEERIIQVQKVIEDKTRESNWGHDGCWVSHPFFIGPALKAFPKKNQLPMKLSDFDKYSDILPKPEGQKTLEGLRTNIRVGIAYMHGWAKGIGCVAFDNLMEDLATLEISRAQVWQWLHHKIQLTSGEVVTKSLIENIFAEESARIKNEFGPQEVRSVEEAAKMALEIFTNSRLEDFLCSSSDEVL